MHGGHGDAGQYAAGRVSDGTGEGRFLRETRGRQQQNQRYG
jgi:hypothetical protein